VPTARGTKQRAFTTSGEEPSEVPSRSRPHKPPAKAIAARTAAGKTVGGGKTPPKIRERLVKEHLPRRTHDADDPKQAVRGGTRYGKREPEGRRHARAADMRDAGGRS
jgi:hypothetical protein